MALRASNKALKKSRYEPIRGVFCDGIEVQLGDIPKKEAERMKNELINDIHGSVEDLHIKHIKISERNGKTYAWITLTPETAGLTCRLMSEVMKIVEVIKDHLAVFWDDDEDELEEVEPFKLDVT